MLLKEEEKKKDKERLFSLETVLRTFFIRFVRKGLFPDRHKNKQNKIVDGKNKFSNNSDFFFSSSDFFPVKSCSLKNVPVKVGLKAETARVCDIQTICTAIKTLMIF